MSAKKIETLIQSAGLAFEKIDERKWKLTSGAGPNLTATLEWLDHPQRKDE
jgi:hypothetical protein